MTVSIRQFQSSDIAHLRSLSTQASIQRMTSLPADADDPAIEKYVAERLNQHNNMLTILYEESFAGFITLSNLGVPEIFQIGYFIDETWQIKGIATFAIGACIPPLFQGTSCLRLQAMVEPDNIASCRVLEKCGFAREGLLARGTKVGDVLVDAYMYAIIKP